MQWEKFVSIMAEFNNFWGPLPWNRKVLGGNKMLTYCTVRLLFSKFVSKSSSMQWANQIWPNLLWIHIGTSAMLYWRRNSDCRMSYTELQPSSSSTPTACGRQRTVHFDFQSVLLIFCVMAFVQRTLYKRVQVQLCPLNTLVYELVYVSCL